MILRSLIFLLLILFIFYNIYKYIISIKIHKPSKQEKHEGVIDVEYEEVD